MKKLIAACIFFVGCSSTSTQQKSQQAAGQLGNNFTNTPASKKQQANNMNLNQQNAAKNSNSAQNASLDAEAINNATSGELENEALALASNNVSTPDAELAEVANAPQQALTNAPITNNIPANAAPVSPPPVNSAPVNAVAEASPQPVPSASNVATQTPIASPSEAAPEPTPLLPPGVLQWIGYNYQEEARKLQVELITEGQPHYRFIQEVNQAKQPEIIIRYLNTSIKKILRRDINASEFRAPVAHIRVRENVEPQTVDVVLTLRDNVKPRVHQEHSQLLITFAIPDRYYGPIAGARAPDAKAENLLGADVLPMEEEKPKVATFVPDPTAGAFQSVPADGGTPLEAAAPAALPEAIPEDAALVAPAEAPQASPASAAPESPVFDDMTRGGNFAVPQGTTPLVVPGPGNSAPAGGQAPVPAVPENENLEEEEESSSDAEKFNVYLYPTFKIAHVAQENFSVGEEPAANPLATDAVEDFPAQATAAPASAAANSFPANATLNGNAAAGNVASGNIAPLNTSATPNVAPLNAATSTNIAPAGETAAAPVLAPGESDIIGSEPGFISEGTPGLKPKKALKLDFRAAPIAEVIRVIATESGINFVIPPEVGSKTITLSLANVPWDVALKAVLETNSLGMAEIAPGLIRIDELAKFSRDKQAEQALKLNAEKLTPTKILVMRLNYAKAADVTKVVQAMLGATSTTVAASPAAGTAAPANAAATVSAASNDASRFRVQADERTNSIIVEATPIELAKIKALIERIDLQTPQVKISSRILEVVKSNKDYFGISWGGPMNYDQGHGLGFGSLPFPNYMNSSFAIDPGISHKAGDLNLRLGSINNAMALDFKIRAEETRGTTEILQNQTVYVQDNEQAEVVGGLEDVFSIAATGPGGQSVFERVTYNLSLKVTPRISADGSVQMKLEIVSDNPQVVNTKAQAGKTTRRLNTTLLRRSGETAVIGGLYTTSKVNTITGIPILSKIPIIGALFRSTNNDDSQRELLIMVTPNIVTGAQGESGTPGSEFDAKPPEGTGNISANTPVTNAANVQSGTLTQQNQQNLPQQGNGQTSNSAQGNTVNNQAF